MLKKHGTCLELKANVMIVFHSILSLIKGESLGQVCIHEAHVVEATWESWLHVDSEWKIIDEATIFHIYIEFCCNLNRLT
mgnify:CR=1 FL=1